MKESISCHEGKCFRVKTGAPRSFEELFENETFVDKIEKDIWKNNFYGQSS